MDKPAWIGLGFGLVIAAALWASDGMSQGAILPQPPSCALAKG